MNYAVRRVLYLLLILLIVTVLTSLMLSFLPGDPARAILGPGATPAQIAVLRQQLHLDQPFWQRYWYWLWNALHGNLGVSYRTNLPVRETIASRIPISLELTLAAQLLAMVGALVLATYSAYRPGGVVDRLSTFLSFGFISIPTFASGLLLIIVFAAKLGWFPIEGWVPLTQSMTGNLRSLVLPAVCLAIIPCGMYQRVLRADLSVTLGEPYILAAQVRGLSPLAIMVRHAIRPSVLGVLTVAGLTTATLIGGTVIVETVFGIPGLGQLMVNSINSSDYVVIQALVAFIAVVYVVVNALTDMLYLLIDPRLAHAGS